MSSSVPSSRQIRQDFLDFFKSKQHTIVSSSSLMPDSPNLLFTNAGMNQFVPIFLAQTACPYKPGRAADTQKCIRAGGKHNDLDDVGMDTYHHTFFEMLGNWSFGDYFKKEAIDWAWELITEIWKFPPNRLYATVYQPDKSKSDPADFDHEAYAFWEAKFSSAGLDPKVHIVSGNKKDNFWMMGDTGPCGPCSELHVDLTLNGDTRGSLVNQGSPLCIEIWNLVFIQFNANADGTFSALPARHVDTGMGFERVTGIIQNTKNFTDFSGLISNYETDIFQEIFARLEAMSGKKYRSTLPLAGEPPRSEQEKIDIAFRVIADHIRTLSFAIADGIQPGNSDRHYVLRRILRRAVRYGRTLGFTQPFFYQLVDTLVEKMGSVFPELAQRKAQVQSTLRLEEEAFNRTLDRGIELFKEELSQLQGAKELSGEFAFKLYDTYGFPIDLTELMAREQGLTVDKSTFEKRMEEQRERARAAQKKEVIEVSQISSELVTRFDGFDQLELTSGLQQVVRVKDRPALILDATPFYAEMGGQVGDSGRIFMGGHSFAVTNTQKAGGAFLHFLDPKDCDELPAAGATLRLEVDRARRHQIQRHHTVTHLLHWALHEVVSREVAQKGSYVGPEKLTFDFNGAALTPTQVSDVERLVNEKILENASVSWIEVPHSEVKGRSDVMQFFGDKYGEKVRVVQVGGKSQSLNGYSMELCGGTHTRATGEIGVFRLVGESAIAAGVRRIEALAGEAALARSRSEFELLTRVAGRLNTPLADIEKKLESLLDQNKELEKVMKAEQARQAAQIALGLLSQAVTHGDLVSIVADLGEVDGNFAQNVADALKSQFKGVVVLGSTGGGAVTLIATVSPEYTSKVQAGKIIQTIAPIVGGKGGGRPDNARGGGKETGKLKEALSKAKESF